MSSDATAVSAHATRVPGRSKFFCGMSAALLLIVIAGFAPTLYLRPLLMFRPCPPISTYTELFLPYGSFGSSARVI